MSVLHSKSVNEKGRDNMTDKYSVYGLDGVYITSNWNGNGCAPYRYRVLHKGEVWAPNNRRRRFFDFLPPDDNYIYIADMMSQPMIELSNLAKEHRLLDGDIQWDIYADDKEYRAYVDSRAAEWLRWLLAIDEYWFNNQATDKYKKVRNMIYREISNYEFERERDKKNKRGNTFTGTTRIGGRDIPKRIEDDNDLEL